MKNLLILLIGIFLFAGGLYESTPNIEFSKSNLNLLLKVSMKNNIRSAALNKNIVALIDYSKVKVFNLNGDLLKSFKVNNGEDIGIYKDKLFVIDNKNFYIYSLKDFKLLAHKTSQSYSDLSINKNLLGIVKNYSYIVDIYDLEKGKKLNSFRIDGDWLKFSPNNKYLISSDKIYTLSGDLYSNLDISFYDMSWLDDKTIIYTYDNKIYLMNIKSSNKIGPFYNGKRDSIDFLKALNDRYVLVFNDNIVRIFDVKNKKLLDKEFILKNRDDVSNVKILENKMLVYNRYRDNAYLYDISPILDYLKINKQVSKKAEIKETTKTDVKKQEIATPKHINKIEDNKISKENKKPFLKFYASTTEGYAPLKVDFKVLCNDEDGKIVSYYVNIAGKEKIGKGNPNEKSFSYTFTKPGEYNIMFAIKDDKGAITTSEIKIKVREESFEDYKKSLMGN